METICNFPRVLVWTYSYKETDGLSARGMEELGRFCLTSNIRQEKISLINSLSRNNIKFEVKTVFVNAFAADAEQTIINYCSWSWQLHTMKRVKLRDLQQRDNQFKELY